MVKLPKINNLLPKVFQNFTSKGRPEANTGAPLCVILERKMHDFSWFTGRFFSSISILLRLHFTYIYYDVFVSID